MAGRDDLVVRFRERDQVCVGWAVLRRLCPSRAARTAIQPLYFLAVVLTVAFAPGCQRSQPAAPPLEELESLPVAQQQTPAQPAEPLTLGKLSPVTLKVGESTRIDVTVNRGGRSGPISLEVRNLPSGVSAKTSTIPDGQSKGEIILTAESSAAAEADVVALVEIQAKLAGEAVSQSFSLTIPKLVLPDFQVPERILLRPGAETAVTVTLEKTLLPGEAQLTFEQLPEGVAVTPTTVTPQDASVSVKLAARADQKEGEFPITASLSVGSRKASKSAKLVVAKEFFSLQCFQVVTLKPGETREVSISVRRNGYPGPIQIASSNLPEGVTLTVSDVPENASSVVFKFTVSPQAHERVRSVWIHATGGGTEFKDAIVVRVKREDTAGFLPVDIGYDPEIAPLFRRGSFGGRLTAKSKAALCDAYGGTPESEEAILRGLRWLAAHQETDGRWSLKNYGRTSPACDCHLDAEREKDIVDSDTGGTGLALLPFLGAGITHEGSPEQPAELARYRNGVRRGLQYLMRVQTVDPKSDRDGYLGGNTYAHAIATMALCEAYGLTGDERIQLAAQRAIKYLMNAQHKEGGWRYGFREAGDTSVLGWVFLAIRSGQLAGLRIENSPLVRASRFLDSCGVGPEPHRLSEYCYQPGGEPKISLTAAGLLTRQYLGWPRDNPHLVAGCRKIMTQLPPKDGQTVGPLYYYYYATQVLHHMEGEEWDLWNHRMREHLLRTQERSGHRDGSWPAEGTDWGNRGGRIYATSLALMILQEYYRHLPLYRPVPKAVSAPQTSSASSARR